MKKLLALLLLLSMLLAMFAACDPQEPVEPGDDTTDTETDTTETDEPAEPLVFINEGKVEFTIICPDEASNVVQLVSQSLQNVLQAKTAVNKIEIEGDIIPKNETRPEGVLEILVGNCDYEQSAAAKEMIGYGDYIIKTIGCKLVVVGYDDEATEKGVKYLYSTLVTDWITEKNGKYTLTVPADVEITGTAVAMNNELPVFEGGDVPTIDDMGDNARLMVVGNTTKEQYQAYIEKILSAGYSKTEEREILNEKNLYTMLTNDKYMITAIYITRTKASRIIIEERNSTGYDEFIAASANTEAVCLPQLYFIGQNNPNGGYDNGMCVVARLSNGDFIVFDGGWTESGSKGKADQAATRIRETILKYKVPGDTDVRIAAWLITHAHTDHIGAFQHYVKNFLGKSGTPAIDNVLINYPSDKQAAQPNFGNAGTDKGMVEKMAEYRAMNDKLKSNGAKIHKTHAGQVLNFGNNEKLEIIFTYDLCAPASVSNFNDLSIVSRLHLGGQTVMVTGDTSTQATTLMNRMYGADMKSDFLTVPHHGHGPVHNDFVKTVSPSYVLWPAPTSVYQEIKSNSNKYSYWTWFWSPISTVDEIHVAGFTTVIFTLPYTKDNAVVIGNTVFK